MASICVHSLSIKVLNLWTRFGLVCLQIKFSDKVQYWTFVKNKITYILLHADLYQFPFVSQPVIISGTLVLSV